MKKLILGIILCTLLAACTNQQDKKVEASRETIESVKIVSKTQESEGRFSNRYYVEIEKNNNKVKYRVNDQLFDDISVNSFADVVVTSENYVIKIKYVFE